MAGSIQLRLLYNSRSPAFINTLRSSMRLSYGTEASSEDLVTNTTFIDDFGRKVYATPSRGEGYIVKLQKLGDLALPSTVAVIQHRAGAGPETNIIALHGQELKANDYLSKVSRWSSERRFVAQSGRTYEWQKSGANLSLRLDNAEVGHSHSRSVSILGASKRDPYLEISDHPDVLGDLDEIVTTFVYLKVKSELQPSGFPYGLAGTPEEKGSN